MHTHPPKLVYSPDRCAAFFAQCNPRWSGVLAVKSTTPAGLGGRYLKDKVTKFFASYGACAKTLTRHLKLRADAVREESYRNGICPVCGRLYLAPLISWFFDRDGVSVEACSYDLNAHALRLDSMRYLTGGVSHLAIHDIYRVDVTLDIRGLQSGVAVDWVIDWRTGPAGELVCRSPADRDRSVADAALVGS